MCKAATPLVPGGVWRKALGKKEEGVFLVGLPHPCFFPASKVPSAGIYTPLLPTTLALLLFSGPVPSSWLS